MKNSDSSYDSSTGKQRVFITILKYFGFYFLGILACIVFTPVEITLAGSPVWRFYPLSFLGFIAYYLYLTPEYVFGTALAYWAAGTIGLIPVFFEVAAFLRGNLSLKSWRPLWIGFPIGFVGALGIYFSLAGSV